MIAEMKDNCSFYSIIALCFETPNGELLGGKKGKERNLLSHSDSILYLDMCSDFYLWIKEAKKLAN